MTALSQIETYQFIWLLITCSFVSVLSYCGWAKTISGAINFPKLFRGTLTLHKSEFEQDESDENSQIQIVAKDFFYIGICMFFMALLLSISLFSILTLFYPEIEQLDLTFITGTFVLIILSLSRVSGFVGYTQLIDFVHFLTPGLTSFWSVWLWLQVLNVEIPNIKTMNNEFMIIIPFCGIIVIWIIELLLFIEIRYYDNEHFPKYFKFTPTLPWINIFPQLKEVKTYIHRSLLINRVKNIITEVKTSNISTIKIIWLTETVDRKIQKAIAGFVDSNEKRTASIRLLCPSSDFPRETRFNELEKEKKIELLFIEIKPGFLRAISIEETKYVLIGLTTGDSPDAKRGFDAPEPLNWIFYEMLNMIFIKNYLSR